MLRAILLLLCLSVVPAFAQESATVIATADEAGYPINTSQFVWLDNDTLLFEPRRDPDAVGAYEYRVSTRAVTSLDLSPLYFVPTPKRAQHYQIALDEADFAYNSFRSPFAFSAALPHPLHHVIYLSSLRVACGFECSSGLVMAGVHDDQPDYTSEELNAQTEISPLDYISARTYRALNLKAAYDLQVYWARSSAAAIVETPYLLGAGARIYYANLVNQSFGEYAPEIYIDDIYPELGTHLYALSEDGTRVIYGKYQPEAASREMLRVWQVIPAPSDAIWSAQVLPSVAVSPESDAEDAFAGANFIPGDEEHILVLHSSGITRISLVTDEREVLNTAINAQEYSLGVFSPDNQHIAVVTQAGDVRVLPTGIS